MLMNSLSFLFKGCNYKLSISLIYHQSSPLSLSSVLQLTQCHGFYVHPPNTASKYISDQCDRKPPKSCHVSGRSSPSVVQWFQSDCAVYQSETPHDAQNEFDSKIPDTPDRT